MNADFSKHPAGVNRKFSVFDSESNAQSVIMFDDISLIADDIGLRVLQRELNAFQQDVRNEAKED